MPFRKTASKRSSARTDENLKHLESVFGVRIRTQGHDLIVDGEPPGPEEIIDKIVRQLSALVREGFKLTAADVRTAAALVLQDETIDLREHFLKGSLIPGGRRRIGPKSVNQRRYLDAIDAHDVVFAIGPAGTGKTYLAMAQAVAFLVAKKVSRIILARPAVGGGREARVPAWQSSGEGEPVLRPLYDALYDMLDVERVDALIRARNDRNRSPSPSCADGR